MTRKFYTTFFYLGTFITSFGSLLFVMSIPTFFLKAGYAAEIIGVAIGVHRFAGIAASAWFGPRIDTFNSRKVIFLTEFLAAFSSVLLIVSWSYRDVLGLNVFIFFIAVRALTVGVQSSSRSRLIKLLSNDNSTHEATLAIWLNKVTQGAHVISALVAIPLIASGNILIAIAVDGLSFLIGGYSAILLPDLDSGNKVAPPGINIIKSILNLIRMHKSVFIEDQLLALAVSGSILLMVKLSGGRSEYVIYFNFIFGSCIWLSSIFAHNLNLRNRTKTYWLLLLVGYLLLLASYDSIWRFGAYLITYMGYWILYHKYTVEIQTKTPKELIGATMAVRGLLVAATLSVGELFGGYLTRFFDLKVELGIRALFCLIALFVVAFSTSSKKE